jgi:hypothetical protein
MIHRNLSPIRWPALGLVLSLSACGLVDNVRSGRVPDSAARPVAAAPAAVPQRMPGTTGARTAEALDRTTAAERAAAVSAGPGGGTALGKVRVSLGSPTEAGFWMQGGPVKAVGKGRVVTASGQAVAVELRPGGAAQLSLAAYRALGLGLTDLPEVTVYAQ